MKKFYKLICLAACVFCFTACSSNKTDNVPVTVDEDSYKEVIEADLKLLSDSSDEQLNFVIDQFGGSYSGENELADEDEALFQTWMSTRQEVGEYMGVLKWTFDADEESITITARVDYSLRDADYKVTYLRDGTREYVSFNVMYTIGEKMSKAALNTVIGISVVFVVLILISLLIGCFKYINMAEEAMKKRKADKKADTAAAVDNTIAQIVKKEEEELVDDLELVAVISAAIAAYTGTSADGFVVRSIKKSNRKRWQNA